MDPGIDTDLQPADGHLPPRQWTVLILRDVLDWPEAEAAALLGCSVPALRSALVEARDTVAGGPAGTPTGRWLGLAGPGGEIDMARVAALLSAHAPQSLAG